MTFVLSSSVDCDDSPLSFGSFGTVGWLGVFGKSSSGSLRRTFVGLEVVIVREFGRFLDVDDNADDEHLRVSISASCDNSAEGSVISSIEKSLSKRRVLK